MHENSVEVSRLHGADLNGLLSPAHDLVGVDVGWKRRNVEKHHRLSVEVAGFRVGFGCMFCVCDGTREKWIRKMMSNSLFIRR